MQPLSEGFDRSYEMPWPQDELIRPAVALNQNTIVDRQGIRRTRPLVPRRTGKFVISVGDASDAIAIAEPVVL